MPHPIQSYTVSTTGTLRDVLQTLDDAATTIALVVDDNLRLIGTMTDGDVRRALLQGVPLSSPLAPHVQRRCVTVGAEVSRAAVLERMVASSVQQIPIVGPDGRLLGLHLMREIVGRGERPNWGVIMAGGLGLRLRPLTEHVPKPMLTVAGRPILERLVLHMVGFGIRTVFLAINHLGHLVESHFGDGSAFGCHIHYLRERIPLGTAGALALLPERPPHTLLVMNGDLVTQADLAALLDGHDGSGHALTVGVRPYVHTIPFGCVQMDDDRIVSLEEKPQVTRLVNAGIYAVGPAALALIPADEPSTMPGLVDRCLESGLTVGGLELQDDWIDVGQWDQLQQAREGKER